PAGKSSLHVSPQSSPEGEDVMTPSPEPSFVTVKLTGFNVKVAVTAVADSIGMTQSPVPEHAPDHPANALSSDELAASVTTAAALKFAVHVNPQSIPAGVDMTRPVPVPDRATFSSKGRKA